MAAGQQRAPRTGGASGSDGAADDDDEVPAFIREAVARVQSDRDKLAKFQAAQKAKAEDGTLVVHSDATAAGSDDDEPASIRRAREARATGGRAREPVLTSDGAGGVTTARLARPSSADAANQRGLTGGGNDQMLAMLSGSRTPAAPAKPAADQALVSAAGQLEGTDGIDEAARKLRLRGDLHADPPSTTSREVVQHVVDETFGEVDVLGTGSLRDSAHVDRAVGHVLLHHTAMGQQLRAAARAALHESSAAGATLTQADFARLLVQVLGAPAGQDDAL